MLTIHDVLSLFQGVQRTGANQWLARCPAHDDRKQSLSISTGKDGRILLTCHAGCSFQNILQHVGLSVADLSPDKPSRGRFDYKNIVACYEYSNGTRKLRDSGKCFAWQHRDASGEWKSGRGNAPHALYTRGDKSSHFAYIVEGEKDVNNLHDATGALCFSSENGAGGNANGKKWHASYNDALQGKTLRIIPDNDDVGRSFAAIIATEVASVASSVKILDLSSQLPSLKEKGDISDVLEQLGAEATKELLNALEQNIPEWKPTAEPQQNCVVPASSARHTLELIRADELQKKEIPPLQWIVSGLLPEGLTILAAPQKSGKSWFCLQLALSIASGTSFLGRSVTKAEVLYGALEDGQLRLQQRQEKLLNGKDAPNGLHFTTALPTFQDGLVEVLSGFINQHPSARLLIIDVLSLVRGQNNSRMNAYDQDYALLRPLKQMATEKRVAVLLVTHLKKGEEKSDPFASVTGSCGQTATADATILLQRKRASEAAVLKLVGRDMPELELQMRFNDGLWECIGESVFCQKRSEIEQFENSPLVAFLCSLVPQEGDEWRGTAGDIFNRCTDAGIFDFSAPSQVTKKLKELAPALLERRSVSFIPAPYSQGGQRTHVLRHLRHA